ncbi:hypothetical protein RCO27_06865 [Sphingosinicella sp. LHD-64]|uniref:hypothetical protein n=1 Tax=Sphingosinicella sp. LHD-64 TaxID=3072139 RepID=UPI00280F6D28|nr:hypothetical protein [Sphingosinicella sp. LHD-64]MDQ8755947.1 hypothetical protein [Sphingosinicella sp. LHD-64]
MSSDDSEYLEQRAETEIELAQHATDPRVVQAHYDLATAYLDRIHGDEEADPAPEQPAPAG